MISPPTPTPSLFLLILFVLFLIILSPSPLLFFLFFLPPLISPILTGEGHRAGWNYLTRGVERRSDTCADYGHTLHIGEREPSERQTEREREGEG